MKALVKGAMVVCLVVLFFSSNAQTPDWAAPDPSQFTYSVTAIVAPVLEDTLQRNPGDQLAFFSGQEIRGISFFVFGVHFVELFSNQPLDTFSIHYYNAEEDKVYIASNPFLFFEGSNTGLIYEPVLFFFNRQQSQPLSFSPIPDQVGFNNSSFFVLDVSDYLFSSEGDSLIWTFEFPSFLNVSVDGTQLLVDPMNEFTGFVILKVRVEDAFNQNRFAETEILYIVLPDREAPQFKVIPGQGIAVGSEFFNVCDETSSVVFDLREFTQPYSSCLQFDYQVPLFPLNPGVSKPNWDNLKGEMDSMIVYAKTRYTPSVLLNSTDNILGVFSNGERVGVSNDANENTEGIFKIILYDLPEGERLTFSLYSAELANLLDSPSEIFYQPGGQVGSPSLPLILDFSPLRPHLTPEGELSIEVLQKEWIGEQSFVFFARDCDFPDHLFSQQTAIFSVVSSEEELQFYYRDEDNNGLGNPLVFTQHSLNPMGYVSNGWDCAEAFPEGNCLDSLTLYLDQDGRSIFSLSEALPLLSQACGLEGISISQDQFECKDLGRKELQLETMDRNGNSLVRNIPLELRDTIAPLLECVQEFVLGSCQEMIPNAMDFVQIEDNCEGWVVSQEPRAGIPFGSLGDSLVLMNIRVEDTGGNVSFCVVTIRVEDYQPPQFLNCPNTTFTVGVGGDCEGGVIWSIPIALDDCGPVVVEETSLGGPYFGTRMSPGIYPVEYTATDFSGNTAVCQFTVIVSDDTGPLLVCLPNIRIASDPQQCSFTSESDELNPLLATDNCPGWTLTYAYSGAVQGQGVGAIPSTEFPLGKTYVEYRLEDINGNSSYCQFFIEVEDTEPPIVTCPANISVGNDKGICGAVVDYDLDQAIDNCGLGFSEPFQELIKNGGFETGDLSQWQGSQKILFGHCNGPDWTVYEGTGIANRCLGNDFTPVSGNFGLYTSFDGDGPAEYYIEQEIELPLTISEAYLSWLETSEFLVQGALPRALRIGLHDKLGQEISLLYRDEFAMGSYFQSGWRPKQVRVAEDLKPFAGESLIIRITAEIPESFTGPAGFAIDDISLQVNSSQGVQVVEGMEPGSVFPVGTTSMVLRTYDAFGNSSTCSFSITVLDMESPRVDCPKDTILNTSAAPENCGVKYEWAVPLPQDNCGIEHYAVKYTFPNGTQEGPMAVYDFTPGSYGQSVSDIFIAKVFPVGRTLVEYFVEDEAGNTQTCSFYVEVLDDIPPVFENCPQGELYTVSLFPGSCEGGAIWSIPVASDNCGIKKVWQTAGPSPGSILLAGTYSVEYTAEDLTGNRSTCQFFIRITDTENPLLACPANVILVGTDPNECSWTSPLGVLRPLLSSNNCPASLSWEITGSTQAFGNGEIMSQKFEKGISTVHYRLEEFQSGQFWECSFEVHVQDREAPQVSCPERLILECGNPNNENRINEWLDAIPVDDNCTVHPEKFASLFTVEQLCGQTSINRYLIKAIDADGNEGFCIGEIRFMDRNAPLVIKEAEDLVVNCSGTLASGEILAWLNSNGNALATETCGEVIWTHDFTEIGKECGGAGEFQVVFTARDACGNSSSTQSRLIVLDEEAPVWERAPQNKVFECRGGEGTSQELAFWLSTQGGGIAKDKCSSVVYSNDFEGLIVHCGEFSGAAWVTFTAIDECGNESKASAMISFEDTEPPVIITQARDTSVQCDGNGNTKDLESWLKTNGGAQAMDLCSPPISWENEQISTFESCEGRKQIRFRFFAQDDCGNISLNTEATFLIEDTTPPQWLQNPLDKEVSCGSSGELQSWLSQFGGGLAADDCSTVQYSYDLISNTTLCGLGFESEYRFTATDACGNVSHVTAFFAAYDTLPPTITGGSDFYLEDCGQGPLGEYAALNGWLTQNAGALAIDDCGGIIWSNDYNQDNWVYECGNSGYVDVVFTAQDLCGNRSNFTRRFTVGDNRSPTFLNCPVFPIIVNTPQGWCGAHVNFSMPIATDNCSEVNISQVDTSGLSSGSLFPVGLTVLLFEAEDECGNKSTCTYNIIVNQYSEIGLNCPANISSINDQGMSGARIIGLQSEVASNACEGEIPLIYKIVNEQGEIFDCGINNASGSFFKIGDNTVTYQAQDQALLLITEIVSNSDKVELEITNFGPSAMDLTQLQIERRGLNAASYAVGPNTVLYPGDIYVQEFSAVPPGSQNSYFLSFFGRVMDGIALNGFQPTNFLWSGSLMGSTFARNRICDTDSSEDWDATHNCQPHSIGWINPQLLGNIFAWNGAIATFQSKVPIVKECQFIVTIVDEESPECVDKFTVAYKASAAEKHPGECLRVPVEVEEDFLIAGIRLENIKGHFPDMGGLTIDLVAPGGQSFNLFSNLCPGTEDFDLSFYDNATQFVFEMECEPAGKGQAFIPLQSFSPLLGQSSKGTWSLQMYSHLPFEGLMEQWTLILDLKNSYQQQDTLMANEPGLCGRNFTWMHPFYSDNCCPGSISVEYSNIEKGMLPPSKTLEGLGGQSETQFFPVGTTHVKYTLIDETGNTSYCGFSVTVQNTQFPIINQQLCRDVTLYLEPGQCSTLYSYPSLEEVDVCEAVAIYYDPPLDYRFPIGQTEVVIEVVNSAGNSTLCEFTVTVVEFQPSGNSLVCNSLIRLSLGLDCQAEINADMLLEGSNYRCYDNYCIQLIDALGQPIGNSQEGNAIVNLSHVGTLVQANICSCNSVPVNCCTVMIEVEALSFPIVDCPQDLTLFCNDSLDPQSTGFPKITNCVPSAFIDYYDTYADLGSCSNPSAQIQRKWLITTDLGDKIECEQIIFIKPLPTSALSFPEDKTGALALNCSEVNMNTAMILPINTGFPTLGGKPLLGNHFCEFFVSYTDDVHQDINCPGAYQILRTWSVRDECQSLVPGTNPILHVQTIHVTDRIGPEFLISFPDLTISTSSNACSANLDLFIEEGQIVDNCSGVKEVIVLVTGCQVVRTAKGGYQIKNMKKGKHKVRIIASDNCWNYSETYFHVEVEDRIPPVAFCAQDLVISLSTEGVGRLYASSIDLGSYDNCSDFRLEIFRSDNQCELNNGLGEYVEFCCQDLEMGPIPVRLRIWDDADGNGIFGSSGDNFNECHVNVIVESHLIPTFYCPMDLTLDCSDPWENAEFTGFPEWEEGCTQVLWLYTDSLDLNSCGDGSVVRTWNSPNFPSLKCEQRIILTKTDPLDLETAIIWPIDWEGSCTDTILTQKPIVETGGCSSIAISSKDQIYFGVEGVCYEIVRTWTVIEECVYQPNLPNSPGKYTRDQIIRITGNEGPRILNCDTLQVFSVNLDCVVDKIETVVYAAQDFCPGQRELLWVYELDLYSTGNFIPKGQSMGDSAIVSLVNLPVGSHKVKISLKDACGGTTSCIQQIVIEDLKAPSPICTDEIVITLMENGQTLLSAELFNWASYDNCTPPDQLRYSFSGDSILSLLSLDCDNLANGVSQIVPLEVWVWDEAENRDFCSVRILLQDPSEACPSQGSSLFTEIEGKLRDPLGEPVGSASVMLYSTIPSQDQHILSNGSGDFNFSNVMVPGYYLLKASKIEEPMEGVSTLDLVYIHKHILGTNILQTPEQLLAADINNDHKISGEDLVELRNLLLQKQLDFSNNTSWRFINPQQVFDTPQQPWPFDEEIPILIKSAPAPSFSLTGVKIGDVNQSSSGVMVEERSAGALVLLSPDVFLDRGEHGIPIYSHKAQEIAGFQFSLECKDCDVLGVLPGLLSLNNSNMGSSQENYLFSFSHPSFLEVSSEQPLFTLKVKAHQNQWLSESIRLVKGPLKGEVYLGPSPLVGGVALDFPADKKDSQWKLYQNEPNPFRFETKIGFEIPSNQKVELVLHDAKGSLIIRKIWEASQGYNEWTLNRNEIPGRGVYIYTLKTDQFVDSRKMVLVD